MKSVQETAHEALCTGDAAGLRALLAAHPELKQRINDPIPGSDDPPIIRAKSREMLDVLIEAGADLNAKTRWWAGGFGLLHLASPELSTYAVSRGAIVDVHAAARLGMLERLLEIIAEQPAAVNERGGDGQTPLHFAATPEIAELLVAHGADMEARDVDHESTPAQYMVRDRQDVLRHLVRRGCRTDIFLAAALGDENLAVRHLVERPDSIRMRVSDEHFPMIGGKCGGTIYQWTLGWYVSPHEVARTFGHEALFRFLLERSPTDIQLATACWLGDRTAADALLRAHPDLVARLEEPERRLIAHAARNSEPRAVEAMLEAGWPVDSRSQHGGTPLHWAAWHGNAPMARAILARNPPLETTDADFNATPIGWALHGSQNGWERHKGDYPSTVTALLEAGARPPASPGGTAEVQAALQAFQGKADLA